MIKRGKKMTEPIKIRGLKQNNLKNISLDIPKNKIVVYRAVVYKNIYKRLHQVVAFSMP